MIYVGVRFKAVTNLNLLQYCKEIFPEDNSYHEFHSTIVFSSKAIPWTPLNLNLTVQPSTYELDLFKFQNEQEGAALVLKYKCPGLEDRWQLAIDKGATWDFPTFIPHVSLSYNIQAEDVPVWQEKIKTLPLLKQPLYISKEYVEPLDYFVKG